MVITIRVGLTAVRASSVWSQRLYSAPAADRWNKHQLYTTTIQVNMKAL